jgi:hypothetical protein
MNEETGDVLFVAGVYDEFKEGDPRRGPHSPGERAEAATLVFAPNRWHRQTPGVDWFAVQLQFGRGFKAEQLGMMFGIGDSTIAGRKRKGNWIQPMSERDRRKLARLVWLGGIARGLGEEEKSRDALRAMSEWRLPEELTPRTFVPQDRDGTRTVTINQEIPNDIYYTAADPKRDERIAMRNRLDELIARMERDVARGKTTPDGYVVPELAEDAGGTDEAEGDIAGVESVGESGADPA